MNTSIESPSMPIPPRDPVPQPSPPVVKPALLATELTKRYDDTVALDSVDFAVSHGQSVSVTGPSGSGKSTLLYCLAGVLAPDSGSVHLDAQRVDTLPERRRSELRRTRYGFVFQFGGLLPELSAEENIALPLMLGGWSRHRAVTRAKQWFGTLGLEGTEHRRPGQLSGGQAQRVAIARALATNPAVVFADEPTGALDSATGAQVMALLTSVVTQQGAALIVVTHNPAVAASCDRHLQMTDGRIGVTQRASR